MTLLSKAQQSSTHIQSFLARSTHQALQFSLHNREALSITQSFLSPRISLITPITQDVQICITQNLLLARIFKNLSFLKQQSSQFLFVQFLFLIHLLTHSSEAPFFDDKLL